MNRTLVRVEIVLLCVSAVCAPSLASAQPAGVSRYTLNGKPIEPSFVSLNGTPERPVPGDLMWLDGMFLVYNGETVGDFRSTPPEDGRLLLRSADGTEQAVGAKIGWTFKGDTKVIYNPLARLSDSEIRGLRGILIDEWNDQIADRLRHLDPHAACVTITGYTGQEPAGSLPPLPAGLQYLNIDAISGNKIEDFSRLQDQTALRFLVVRATGGVIDAKDIALARNLRSLNLGGNELRNVSELRNLPELRTLELAYGEGVDNLAFATPMKRLTYLDIRRTQVRDLTPLDGLDALKSVYASRAPVATLPKGVLSELRQLDVMSTALDDRTVAGFAKAHSGCRVQFHWMAALRDVLPGVTRARVRTGGTCHRDPRQERTLFETQNVTEINELLRRISIDESHEQFECMCCGDPSFEFYRGEKLIASLGFHHGQSIRWPGVWPGDGALTAESARAVCQWLDKHGAPDSLKHFEAQERARQAAQRRMNEYSRLLPKELETRLRKAQSSDDAVAAFQSGLDDKIERAKLFLRLYGCDQGSWNLYFGLDDLLNNTLLPKVTNDELVKAFAARPDPAMQNGAARWLFCEQKWKTLNRDALKTVIPIVARAGLEHPRELNRRMTLRALHACPDGIGTPFLRMVLDRSIPVRQLAPEDQDEPGGMVKVESGDDVSVGSDQAIAALLLAKSRDRESLAAIRRLAQTATGEDKPIVAKAIKLLADH